MQRFTVLLCHIHSMEWFVLLANTQDHALRIAADLSYYREPPTDALVFAGTCLPLPLEIEDLADLYEGD